MSAYAGLGGTLRRRAGPCLGTRSKVSHTGIDGTSNLLTAGAYLVLAGLLLALCFRPRLPFRLLIFLFAVFIASCGVTHLAHLLPWTTPWALPWTAAVSVLAAVATAVLWPKIWRLPETVEAWHRSERIQLALAMEATQLGIWEFDPAGTLHCSESMNRILGLAPGTVPTTESITAQVHPQDRMRREKAMAAALAQGEGAEYRMEYRITRADGACRWIEARGRVSHGSRMTGTLLDITERREALEHLQRSSHQLEKRVAETTAEVHAANARRRESEERFRSAFDAAAVGMALVSLEGRFLRVNRALSSIVGYPTEVLVWKTFQDITHPDDLATDLDLLNRLVSGAIPSYDLEKRYVRPDGRITWVLLTVSLMRDPAGEPLYFISQIQDIDARKRAEAEHHRAQTALTQAKDAAEAANRAKSEFLARMSHELRTPLNAIIGFSDLMLSGGAGTVSEVQSELLEPVVRNGRHLLGLIDDILDLSKIEAGRSDIEMGPVDVCGIVERLALDFEPQLQGRPVRLRTEVPTWGRPEPVWADAVRLRQVVLNLVSNAVKFTREGAVTVRLGADESSRRVQWIEVEDTGIGIPADRLEAIFDAFEQAQSDTSRRYGGTGLGLTISRRLCEQMGCRLDVRSQVGEGSTFRITFAVEAKEAAAAA
jgi:PAS domain S-box-containing protein